MINIVSKNKCIINVDMIGTYQLSLISVSGLYNPIIIDENDWIEFADGTLHITERIVNTDIHLLNEYLTTISNMEFETNPTSMITLFPKTVVNCSNRFKHIYNLISFPTDRSTFAQTNGPMILLIKSEHLSTEMRFCNQSVEQYASIIPNIVSVNLNSFSVGYPFSLSGYSFKVYANQLKHLEFKIVDIYGNDVEFINDLIWTFTLEKIENNNIIIGNISFNESEQEVSEEDE
jgi:hypothetical protein